MPRRLSVKSTSLILFQLAAFLFYAWLRFDNARIVHEPRSFGDSPDYFRIASLPVLSAEFWTESKPPLTSFFWKLVNSEPERIFDLQLYISTLCWGVLAAAFAQVIRSQYIKPFSFALVLGFSLSRDVFMWDPFLGSESLALSFTALFLSCGLWLLSDYKPYKIGLLLFTAFLMVFTRDTYAYVLLMATAVILVLFWSTRYRRAVALMSAAFVILYLFSSALANAGLRPYRAVLMITALRVFPSEEYTDYFRTHGIPVDDALVEKSRAIEREDKFEVYKALYADPAQEEYRRWAHELGRRDYFKFLWFFKSDTLQKVFLETPGQSFYPDVYYYTATGYHPIIKDTRLSEFLYPTRYGLVFFFAANILAAFLAAVAWQERKVLWLLPLLMVLLTYPQAVLVWAGDANDIARHSVAHNVLLRLGAWMLAFFVLDYLFLDILPKLTFFKRGPLSSR